MHACYKLVELGGQRKINSKVRLHLKRGSCINTSVLVKFKSTSQPTSLPRARSGLLRQRCMCVNQSENNFDLSLYIAVILLLYSTRFIDIKLSVLIKKIFFNISSLLHVRVSV